MGSNGYTSHKWSITLGQKWTWNPEIISSWKFQLDFGWPWDTLRTLGFFEVQNQAPSTHVPYELYRIWTTRNIQEKSIMKIQLDLGISSGVFEVQNQAPNTHVPYELYRIWTTRNIQEKSIMKIQLDLGISSGFSRYRIRHPAPMSLMSSTRNIQEKSIMKIQLDLGISSGFSRYRIRHPAPMSLMSSTEYEPAGTKARKIMFPLFLVELLGPYL